ncbi:hypothetical protein HDE_05957 [Halotydeus destructor]|nr:hypothetical protein HDE_05957 [Halotydeus destructor]
MPFPQWNVEPVYLCRKPLPPDKQSLYEFDALANASMVGAIRQLAFVANASVAIFDDLANQCTEMHRRTTELTGRIRKCKLTVSKLDAKKEPLFVKATQPSEELVSSKSSPGKTEIKLHHGAHVGTEAHQGPTGRHSLNLTGFEVADGSTANLDQSCRLPSPRERMEAMSKEFSPTFVPIDISGVTFQRMSSFRKSLLHGDTPIKRRKPSGRHCKHNSRRSTMSEVKDKNSTAELTLRRYSDGSLADKCDQGVQTETMAAGHCQTKVLRLFEPTSTASLSEPADQHVNQSEVKSTATMTSLSAAAVRLREVSTGKNGPPDDGGRSSSGNWSASSSTHASVDSDPATPSQNGRSNYNSDQLSRSDSQQSIGKDSVLSESLVVHHPDTDCASSVQECTFNNGYMSDTSLMSSASTLKDRAAQCSTTSKASSSYSSDPQSRTNAGLAMRTKHPVKYANRDSESWLKYFDAESSDTTITPTETCNNSDTDTITPSTVVSPAAGSRRGSQSSFSAINNASPSVIMDDEVESVHSMDTDGYYTSMHTDSGLFRGHPVTMVKTPNSSVKLKGKRASMVSAKPAGSPNTVPSRELPRAEATPPVAGTTKPKSRSNRPPPPPPPPRKPNVSLVSSAHMTTPNSGRSLTASDVSRSHSPSPGLTTNSESENSDGRRRRQKKTSIDSSRYPSMCAISSSDDSSCEGSSPRAKLGLLGRGFRIRDIFSSGPLQALSRSLSKSRDSLRSKEHNHFRHQTKHREPIDKREGERGGEEEEQKPLMPFNMYGSEDGSSSSSPARPSIRSRASPLRAHVAGRRLISPFAKRQPSVAENAGSEKEDEEDEESAAERKKATREPSSSLSPLNLFGNRQVTGSKLSFASNATGEHSSPATFMSNLKSASNLNGIKSSKSRAPNPFSPRLPDEQRLSPVINLSQSTDDQAQLNCDRNEFSSDAEDSYEKEIDSITSEISKSFKLKSNKETAAAIVNNNNIGDSLTPTRNYKLTQLSPPKSASTPISPPTMPADSSPTSALQLSPKKSTMSTDQLQALIHNSKKKLNLKIDFDSVSLDQPQQLHRTRSLTPNSFSGPAFGSVQNRRSWAGSDPPSTRKELAADRLGPPKPTTIKDFKRLLSQARPQAPPNQRRSAAELLQVSPTKESPTEQQQPFDFRSITSLANYSPGSKVAPLTAPVSGPNAGKTRVINGRIYRTPYRLETMYPPIIEGSQEDLAKSREKLNSRKSGDYGKMSTVPEAQGHSAQESKSTWV